MPTIRVDGLVKEFRRPKRYAGPLGGVRTLFTRQYTTTRAVDGVSFEIEPGELVGYLGPNGAGKSTTIKMLTGILVPTSGLVEVAGVVPWRERERNALHIGVVFGQRSAPWWDLPLAESFRLIAKLYRVPKRRYEENLERFVDPLGMAEFLDTPVRQLSLGQRMRGDLAAAMLYEPRVLYDGPVEDLVSRYAPHRELVVHLAPEADGGEPLSVPGAELVRRADHTVWLRFDPAQVAVSDLIGSVTARHRVTDLSIVEPELEGVVRTIYTQRDHA